MRSRGTAAVGLAAVLQVSTQSGAGYAAHVPLLTGYRHRGAEALATHIVCTHQTGQAATKHSVRLSGHTKQLSIWSMIQLLSVLLLMHQ